MRFLGVCCLLLAWLTPSYAAVYLLPSKDKRLLGQNLTIHSKKGDDFDKLGRQYDVGYWELRAANPTLNPLKPLKAHSLVIIPKQTILPDTPQRGIVINLAELRLYYYKPHSQEVYTYPVGIGQPNEVTPVGHFYIKAKIKNPVWHPPVSSRKDYAKKGITLPKVVPAGPANPLGHYAMHLNIWNYLIHGTNEPDSIGKRSSGGCIHLYPEDIKQLFSMVSVNTPVTIINHMYKVTISQHRVYLEAEQPLSEQQQQANRNLTPLIQTILANVKPAKANIDWTQATAVGILRRGMPTDIGGLTEKSDGRSQQDKTQQKQSTVTG